MTFKNRILIKIITLICIISFPLLANSQVKDSISIGGKVQFPKDKKAVENIFIEINGNITESDKKGNFIIKIPTSALYVFSFYGNLINDTIIEISPKNVNSSMLLTLNKSSWTERIDKIIVTGSKSKIKLSRTPASVESLAKNIILNTNAVNGSDILNKVPSVAVVDGQANIRSGSGWSYGAGSRVAVLLDGLPLISAEASKAQWSFVPMEILSNVEVLKGSSGVLYGTSALNGIINLISQKPGGKKQFKFDIYNGVYAIPPSFSWTNSVLMRKGASMVTNVPFKNGGVLTHFNITDDQGFRMGDYDQRFRVGTHIFHQIKLTKTKMLNYGLKVLGQTGHSASFLLWDSYDDPFVPLDSNVRNTKNQKFLIDPYVGLKTSKTDHTIKMRFMGVKNDIERLIDDPSQNNQSDMIHTEYNLKFKKLPHYLILNVGLGHTEMRSNSDLTVVKHQIQESFVFSQIEQKLKKIYWQVGIKYAQFTNDDNSFKIPIARAGISYKLTLSDHFRISAGSGYRFPSIAELYTKTTAGNINIFPSPNLQPEKGENIEVGYRKFIKYKGLSLMFDAALYRMHYENMSEFTFGKWAGGPTINWNKLDELGFTSINIGETLIQGIDLSVKGKLALSKNSNLRFMAGYDHSDPQPLDRSFVYAEDSLKQGKTFENTSLNDSSKYLKYRFLNQVKADIEYSNKKFFVGFSLRGMTGFTNVDKDFTEGIISLQVPGIGEALEDAQGWNWLLDYRIGYQFTKVIRLSLIHTNATNNIFMIRPADLTSPGLVMLKMNINLMEL